MGENGEERSEERVETELVDNFEPDEAPINAVVRLGNFIRLKSKKGGEVVLARSLVELEKRDVVGRV